MDFMPHKTPRGKLAFSWHNLNPVNVYRVLTTKVEKINVQIDPKDNCSKYDETTKQCTECKEGFYLESDEKATGYCASCSAAAKLCSECSKSSAGKVECEICTFPYMPNKELDTCVQRITLYWYFFIYLGVTVVLTILTCLEKPKTEEDEIFESGQQKSAPDLPSTSFDSRDENYHFANE